VQVVDYKLADSVYKDCLSPQRIREGIPGGQAPPPEADWDDPGFSLPGVTVLTGMVTGTGRLVPA
jgi:hypothetical protein